MQITKPGDQCQLTVGGNFVTLPMDPIFGGIAEELFISNYKFFTSQYAYPSDL